MRQDQRRQPGRDDLIALYETMVKLLLSLPRFTLLDALKAFALRRLGATVGKRVVFYPGLWIMPARNLVLGDDVDLAYEVLITTGGGVSIGDRAMIGYRTQILSSQHTIPPRPQRMFDMPDERAPVNIERDVWIGGNCMILPGVRIGEGAVVAAGSVVVKDVAPFTIVGGTPAKLIREREGPKIADALRLARRHAGAA